jgi:hypothetical protein
LITFSAAQDARWPSPQADFANMAIVSDPTQTSGKAELCDHARSRRMPEVITSRAPGTECLHAHARVARMSWLYEAHPRHSRVSLRNGPFRIIPDSPRSPQGFETRVARPHHRFSTVENRSHPPHANMHRCDRMTQGRQTVRAVAQSLRDTLADCAHPRPRPHHRFSMVENRPRRPPMPTCVQASV